MAYNYPNLGQNLSGGRGKKKAAGIKPLSRNFYGGPAPIPRNASALNPPLLIQYTDIYRQGVYPTRLYSRQSKAFEPATRIESGLIPQHSRRSRPSYPGSYS